MMSNLPFSILAIGFAKELGFLNKIFSLVEITELFFFN